MRKLEIIDIDTIDSEYVNLAYSEDYRVLNKMATFMDKALNLKILSLSSKSDLFSLVLCYKNTIYFGKK